MGAIISIRIDEETAAYVKKQVDDGRYASESDVIEEALRLLKESEEDEIEALRAAIDEGEASGEPQPFDFDAFIERKKAQRAQR